MPEITCDYGHTMSVGTDEWIGTLTLDQIRYARDQMDAKIKAAEEQPKRVVWRVGAGGWIDGNYREEEFEKAAEHLLRIFKERFIKEAKDFIDEPYSAFQFAREIPHITAERVTQFEYETEWFPA
ncbi:hypothetical protein N5J76_03190 [Pseudomonas sp. GD03855]|nr:hypothetical protein [Pseudomonas sp. GD03856]MDH2263924.1 hypothetical protein [Pseudomonas sp. GD03855]